MRDILGTAVRSCSLKITEFLLNTGIDPNHPNYFDDCLLHAACAGNNLEMVELLLNHGADPTVLQLRDRMNPLRYMIEEGDTN